MFQRTLKLITATLVMAGTALSIHAQMAQDPLLSRTATVQPNIVFMFDDSGSMNSTALYQYGGGAGYQGQRGPNNDTECNSGSGCVWVQPPTTFHGRSPDVNLIYYDPRVTYSRRINADGTFQAAGSTASISSFDVYFYKPPVSNIYSVSGVNVTARGSGYPVGSSIIASFPAPPAGGTQATATVQTTATQNVGSVTVNATGRDFNAVPTVTFGAPPAGGIQATGTVQTASTLKVTGVTVGARGVDYPAGTTVTFAPPPGAGVQATGTLVIAATNKVASASPVTLGSGYTSAPAVTFAAPPAPGVTATGTAALTSTYRVATATVGSGGSGYPATGVTAVFSGSLLPGGVPAAATVTTALSQSVVDVTEPPPGTGFGWPATVTGTFSAPGGSGTTATANVVTTAPTFKVGSYTISAGGGYSNATNTTTTTSVILSAPNLAGGVQATAKATRSATGSNRPITSIVVNNAGTGYTSPPVILGYTGWTQVTAASVTVNMLANGRGIQSITVATPGSGYTSTPTLTLSGGGTLSPAPVVNMDGNRVVSSVTLTNPGLGYTSPPSVVVSSPTGSGATIALTTSTTNVVSGISITNAGSGYSTAPAITFAGGGGSGAAYTANLTPTNWITGVTITNPGYGYTGAPTITLNGFSPGTGAILTATTAASLGITGITITNPGAGYTGVPSMTIGNVGSGTGFSGTVNMGTTNQITGITVTSAGSGYVTQPPLTLTNTSPGTGVAYTVSYSATPVQPANQVWNGTGTPTTSASYYTPSYTPDSGSPLAPAATAGVVYPNTASSSTATYPLFKNRTDCVSTPGVCTWAEEQQNYANWKTYHNTRLNLAKTGIGLAFQPLNPTFRLGWGTINTLNGSSTLDKGVRTFSGTVVSDFMTWLYARTASSSNSTPNRIALNKVGQYFQRRDTNGPWADAPNGNGAVSNAGIESTHATCRRSYAMLMTDGYYNDSFTLADVDTTNGPAITSPTSYQYIPIGPYSDTNSTQVANQFADVAMKYWVNDLRPDLANAVKAVPGDEAFWQHMNFYAIGLGLVGTLDATNPAVLASLTGNAGTSPPRALSWPTGTANDPRAIDDMWHATVNGRGKLLNAKTAAELNSAIAQMMSDIGGKEGVQAGVAVSTATLTKDTKKYTPTYTPITWNGNVTAYNLDPTTGQQIGTAWQVETLTATDPTTGKKTFSSIIPNFATRNIVVGNGATSGARAVPFTLASLTAAGLNTNMTGTVNSNLIDYLRGDATNEDTSAASASASAIYRERLTRLGDIVNSTPTFVKDSFDGHYEKLPVGTTGQSTYQTFVSQKKARGEGVLFVGANDGMLHGFRDGTFDPLTGAVADPGGIEIFAYIPYALLPTISNLADKAYVHRYYVDGPTVEVDAYLAGAGRWANLLVGSTGGGAEFVQCAVGSQLQPGRFLRTGLHALRRAGWHDDGRDLGRHLR
ncbi:hypothetical protein [Caenimonas koreensis]|uniref:hypothetical protein n=1 Tax=Caenimonas koreensis TaxID=367474 RepID=UPI003784FB07